MFLVIADALPLRFIRKESEQKKAHSTMDPSKLVARDQHGDVCHIDYEIVRDYLVVR